MKQILQDLSKGATIVADVPCPRCKPGHLLIQTQYSLISAGTERMLVDFGRSGYLEKARQQPDKVHQVLDKMRTDGVLSTIDAVRSKLDQPLPMGYSNVGTVLEVGKGVEGFTVGDRVVSNGHHAEVVCVPQNLCAKIPHTVGDDEAAFTVVGAIALQGIRLAQPTMGECVAVVGLGLIGLMTVQLLRAQGCRVLGLDFDAAKLKLAESFGAETVNLSAVENSVEPAMTFSRGRGMDAVLITASTKSSDPVHQAALMSRKRGRIILVGVTGLELSRADFFEKELSFQVSCSYGPGRYDPLYELEGNDYPVGFVRWTEQRNFEAVLDMLSAKSVDIAPLISHRFPIAGSPQAYDTLMTDKGALGLLLEYDTKPEHAKELTRRALPLQQPADKPQGLVVGAIGAGNYASRILLPAFKNAGARFKTIATSQGVTGTHHGRKLGFEINTTDSDIIFKDPDVSAVVIGTPHNSHARFVCQALDAGKSVFVEKPLALTHEELEHIDSAYRNALDRNENPKVMVGFNRRFAPLMQRMKRALVRTNEPMSLIYTCNAGAIPPDHWTQDPRLGGGRIIGEACHFIDIARFLIGSPIISVDAKAMRAPEGARDCRDTATITLGFENGSLATVHYFANGHRAIPKERVETFQAGRVMVMDNFRSLRAYGFSGLRNHRSLRQDKGQNACCQSFVAALENGGTMPIPYEELLNVSKATIDAAEALRADQ